MEIYFIRHTSVNVPAGFAYGQTDVPLKESFLEEAQVVKSALDNISFDMVYTSPLSRCSKLANYCGYADAKKDNRLMELNFGKWEMKSWEEISSDPESDKWFNNWIETPCPNGESFLDQFQRVSEFIKELNRNSYKRVCVFAHGGILTAAQVYNGIYSIQDAFKNIPSYGEVIKIKLP